MMPFNDFVHKHKLKNKAASKIKIYQVPSSIGLDNVGIYLRDGPISSDIAIVNLHPTKGIHLVAYMGENYFDSYGCVTSMKVSTFFIKRNGHCFYSEYKLQGLTNKNVSYCPAYCV